MQDDPTSRRPPPPGGGVPPDGPNEYEGWAGEPEEEPGAGLSTGQKIAFGAAAAIVIGMLVALIALAASDGEEPVRTVTDTVTRTDTVETEVTVTETETETETETDTTTETETETVTETVTEED